MTAQTVSLAIVGAGPAGLAAAAQAASLGVDTLVLDMHPRAGGHYFNLPAANFKLRKPSQKIKEGIGLVAQAMHDGAEIWTEASVWGIYPEEPFRVCLSGSEVNEIRAHKVILAPGGIERQLPFPGWTLPGVVTAGGALSLLKNQQMLLRQRILLTGSGPLQLAAAAQLSAAGAHVLAVLELQTSQTLLDGIRRNPSRILKRNRLSEGMSYFSKLISHGIQYRTGWTVIEALGENEVNAAVIARVDAAARPIDGSERTIQTDWICLGYGLLPDTQFTRILACDHIIHPKLRVWVPVRDEWLQTSMPGVFAIGDAADVLGKEAAVLEGKLAGLAVAIQLHRIAKLQGQQIAEPLREKLAIERGFVHATQDLFRLPEDPGSLSRPDTVICRCEGITYAQIQEAISDGATSVQAVKYYSRAGMGWCRGVTCNPLIGQIIACQRGAGLEEACHATARPPVFPVPLEEITENEGSSWME